MAIFSYLNPKLTNPEALVTMAAYMPLSKKPKYSKSTAGQILQYVPIIAIFNAFKSRTYGPGEYVLGERFLDHIQGLDVGRRDVPDEAYKAACVFFTIAFGVRITLAEDLDALDVSVDEYLKRPQKKDIPRVAVERAVRLKKSYFPASSYNKGPWNLNHFEDNPLVSPIPGIEPDTLYNGEIPGTGYAENGIPRSLDQEAVPSPPPSNPKGIQAPPQTPQQPPVASKSSLDAVGADQTNQPKKTPWLLYGIIGGGLLVVIVGATYILKKK